MAESRRLITAQLPLLPEQPVLCRPPYRPGSDSLLCALQMTLADLKTTNCLCLFPTHCSSSRLWESISIFSKSTESPYRAPSPSPIQAAPLPPFLPHPLPEIPSSPSRATPASGCSRHIRAAPSACNLIP